MRRAYKYPIIRLKPNVEEKLLQILGVCRTIYNAALEQRIEAYKKQGKTLRAYDQSAEIKELRKEFPWVADVMVRVIQDTLARLDKAYQAFFRRIKSGEEKPGFPKFKGKHFFNSFTYNHISAFKLNGPWLELSKLGKLRLNLHRPIQGQIKTCTIRKEGNRWFAVFSCILPSPVPLPQTGKQVGIDLGLKTMAVTSDGHKYESASFFKNSEKKLARIQKIASRKEKGSKRWKLAMNRVRKLQTKIANQRADYMNIVSKKLVQNNDLIAHEKLSIVSMRTFDPGGAAGRAIQQKYTETAWGKLLWMLQYKGEAAGRNIIAVNAKNTTQACSQCDEIVPKNLNERIHKCHNCGLELDRDHNAAINILKRAVEATQPAAPLAVAAHRG